MSTVTTVEIFQGDDLRIIVEVRDQAGALVDIQNAQAISYALAKSATSAALISKSLGAGVTITNETGFYLDLTAAETAALTPGSYYHEAEIVTSDGLTYTTLSGRVFIRPSLT